LTAGLVVAVLAGAVAFITIQSIQRGEVVDGGIGGGTRVWVVVAASAIDVRSVLTADNVEERQLPVNAVPEGAIRDIEEAIGKVTLVDLYPGEVILAQRIVDPNVVTGDGRLALVVAEDQVLMAIAPADLMSRINILKPGDQVDVLISLDFPAAQGVAPQPAEGEGAQGGGTQGGQREEQVTFHLLQNLTIAQIVGEEGSPAALLLTLEPQDALILKYALDAGGVQDIVLRAPGVDEPFDTEPVDVEYLINRYQIPVVR
jgi:pilus assembly protein CpaB